jgi:HEAT repeat protein
VLIDWLENIDERVPLHERSKLVEALARSLTVREARGVAVPALVRQLHIASALPGGDSLAWAIGNAIGFTANDSCYSELVDVVRDRSLGTSRQMVVLEGLSRMKADDATAVLVELLDDPDVDGQAVAALAKRRDERARAAFERFMHDDRAWVRREARKGLPKLPPTAYFASE